MFFSSDQEEKEGSDSENGKDESPELRWADSGDQGATLIVAEEFDQKTPNAIADAIDGNREMRPLPEGEENEGRG